MSWILCFYIVKLSKIYHYHSVHVYHDRWSLQCILSNDIDSYWSVYLESFALLVIFQLSLEQGQVPKEWTTANVTPLYKKGDRSVAANYRPISLTCILCKVLEHIVASNLVKHLNSNNILSDMQHGFREKRSCETQLAI